MASPRFNDMELAGKVRNLALTKILAALNNDDDPEFKKALLIKLAGNVLPRLNEHSGPDGGDIPIPLFGAMEKQKEPSQEEK